MFKIKDILGNVYIAYGTHVDNRGIVQFVLCDVNNEFYVTDKDAGFYSLYEG